MSTRVLLLVLLFGCSALPTRAQVISTREAEGYAAGQAAAADRTIVPAFVVGVLGGVPLGIGGAHYLGPDRDEATVTPVLIGGTILVGGSVGIILTSRVSGSLQSRAIVDNYERGYRAGFESRLRSRRRSAMAVGSLIGVGIGVVAYSYLRGADR